MTDQEIIRAIESVVEKAIRASEERTSALINETNSSIKALEERTNANFKASEERTSTLINETNLSIKALEERTNANFKASEENTSALINETNANILATRTEIMTYIENGIEKQVKLLAEGQQMLAEKMSERFDERMDSIEGSMVAIEAAVCRNTKNIVRFDKIQK